MTFYWRKQQSGFTIVELLVVIVVIGILAAITIVAYNGIQTRAENTKTVNVVTVYARAFAQYAIDKGEYPSNTTYPCLGYYSDNKCARIVTGANGCNYSGGTSPNTAFDTAISEYLPKKPAASEQRINCSGDQYTGVFVNANSTNTQTLQIVFYLKGNVPCPSIPITTALSRGQTDETTVCRVGMTALT
jgi:prepilin-type N-terminal cleavage/methylation domain-containing protein